MAKRKKSGSGLLEFLIDVGDATKLLRDYLDNPRKVMKRFDLTKEEIKLVESGDFEGIRKLLESKYPGQLNVPITRPFPITPPIRISGSFPITSPPDNGNDNDK
jgi:hypothetical protein